MAHLQTREHKGILVIVFQEIRLIDDLEISEIGTELLNTVTATKLDKVLLNFEHVKFMASSMIGKITMLRKKCIEQKVDLRLCCLTENIKEVFGLMKLDNIFDIYESEEEAFNGYETKKKMWYV